MQSSKRNMKNFIGKKILFFFPSNNKENEWQYHHFINELQYIGIDFELFNPIIYGEYFESELLNIIKLKRKEYSIFMTASYDGAISINTLLEIKKIGLPSVLICYDNLSIPFVHKITCKYYDVVWLTSIETEYLFKKWGAKTVFIPYAANPHIYKPMWGQVYKKNTVGFIGSMYGNRPNILNKISLNKINTEVYTDLEKSIQNNQIPIKKYLKNIDHSLFYFKNLIRFPIGRKCIKGTFYKNFKNKDYFRLIRNEYLNIYPRVSFEEMIKLYSNFTITLNIIDLLDTFTLSKPITKVHLRIFEVPMCGGLQITRRSEEIQLYFEENKEILLYNSDEELIDKCKYYIGKDNIINTMKSNAYLRSIKEHTWENRFIRLHRALYQ